MEDENQSEEEELALQQLAVGGGGEPVGGSLLAKAAVAVAPFEKTGDFKTALTIVMTAMIVTEMEIESIVFFIITNEQQAPWP